ncbi:MAG TPA: PH domain-containing protein [Acidimicrobiia bacterium]|nr:PH domain-containing protein [Acidimicrobiia bacterium]
MRYPEKLLSPDEEIVSQFRPHWSRIAREGLLSILVLVLIILIAIQGFSWGGWVIVGLVALWFVIVVAGFIRWWTTQHVITNERLIHRTGLIAKAGKEIPLEVINDVTFTQSMFERVFGTGDLLIESAGTHGQSRYSDIPDPERVQSLIYEVREDRKIHLESGGTGAAETPASQLAILSRLHDEGKLTDAEFEVEKRKLLGGS